MQDHRNGLIKLLVAEDNPINMLVVTRMLSSLGYNFDAVDNGLDCLKLVFENDYNLLLTDISMPGMDGIQVATEIRAKAASQREIPIIAMTANANLAETERFATAGISHVLSKPFNKADLRDCIEKWI
jgi:CheY-like chemotaxis protein